MKQELLFSIHLNTIILHTNFELVWLIPLDIEEELLVNRIQDKSNCKVSKIVDLRLASKLVVFNDSCPGKRHPALCWMFSVCACGGGI